MTMPGFLFSLFLALWLPLGFAGTEAKAAQRTVGPAREAIGKRDAGENAGAPEIKARQAEEESNWEKASLNYRRASVLARNRGQYQQAITNGNKALATAEKTDNAALQANAILQLAYPYRLVGQGAKARELLQKGVEVVKKIPPGGPRSNIEAMMYRELGADFLGSGDSQKAIDYISYALQVEDSQLDFFKKLPPRRIPAGAVQRTQNNILVTLQRLGNAYRSAGKTEEATRSYERALSMIKDLALTTPHEARLYQELGQLYLQRKDYDRALETLGKAVAAADKSQNAYAAERANSEIGDLLRQTKRPSEAIPYYQKAIASVESSRSALESEDLRSSFFENKRQTYAGIILAYIGAKNWQEAFNYSERARSRAFLDILGSKVQLGHGSLLEEERALQGKVSALRAKLAAQQEETEEDSEAVDRNQLRRELEETQKAYNDFLAKVRNENKEQASLMNVEPLTLKQTQEFLAPGVTMLEYFVVGERVLLWVVEKDRTRFVSSPIGRKDLVGKVGVFRESVFQLGEKEKFRASSQELYKLLIEPALPHIRGKELLIVPHDVLHYLPFQALMSSQGKYLVQDYPIYYLSSASLMQFTKEKKRAGGEKALVMGNPSLGDEAYNLRFAEREATEVASVYPQSAVYLRAEASKTRAMSLSPQYDMLHFAVHAEFNEEDPMSSALLLAPEGGGDGRLKVGEIFSLNLKTNMVVLSACETGLGKLSNGDELVGLTRAFIYAGTPSIVTTLWKVNDRASYELMKEFYQHLRTSKKAEALREAQLKTMKEFPEPFYWAAYQLTGEP
jgi:CHAT domain-containing protein/predicted negative regulator of RcsB-dependent stress response